MNIIEKLRNLWHSRVKLPVLFEDPNTTLRKLIASSKAAASKEEIPSETPSKKDIEAEEFLKAWNSDTDPYRNSVRVNPHRAGFTSPPGASIYVKCADHEPIHLWNGYIEGMRGRDHEKDFDMFDLNVLLDKIVIPINELIGNDSPSNLLIYLINDMSAPIVDDHLYSLINNIASVLKHGGSVGISCIGGHGRTGMILAVLYGMYHQECSDPVKKIKKIYCPKAVESFKQHKLIHKMLGLDEPEPIDEYYKPSFTQTNQYPSGSRAGDFGLPIGTIMSPEEERSEQEMYDEWSMHIPQPGRLNETERRKST